jgi:hypothetical protein
MLDPNIDFPTNLLIQAVFSPDSANPTAALNPAPPAPTTMALQYCQPHTPLLIWTRRSITHNDGQQQDVPTVLRQASWLSVSALVQEEAS